MPKLHLADTFKLRDWLALKRDELTANATPLEGIALAATQELGIAITKANVTGIFDALGWPPTWNARRTPALDARLESLERRIAALEDRANGG